MLFFNKKRYENVNTELEERVLKLEKRLMKAEADILNAAMGLEDMRNKVLRKIQFKKETETSKDLYNGVLIADDGHTF